MATAVPADDHNNEGDGSKIESIHLHWVTQDMPSSDGKDDHLYIETTGSAELKMQFQLDVSFSGQYDYQPGDVRIRIPKQIWHAGIPRILWKIRMA